MINAISLTDTIAGNYFNRNNMQLKILSNLNRINIFIGENNSGKSRMMRLLLSSRNIRVLTNDYLSESTVSTCRNKILNYIDITSNFNNKIILSKNIKDKNYSDFFCEVKEKFELYLKENPKARTSSYQSHISNLEYYLNDMFGELCKADEHFQQKSLTVLEPIYIPILRGIENFNIYFDLVEENKIMNSITMDENQRRALESYKSNASQIYSNKIQKAYGIQKKLIFTAEDLYDEITNKLLGEEKGRTFIKEFQEFIAKQFYEGKEFTLIPQKSKGYLNVKIDSQERALHDLGDGIKQLITILYKIYEFKDAGKVFFIEEPELNLHPGFQRKLMEILQLDMFNKHQFFITTHSNHFIDSCFEYDNISIYKFENINGSNNKFRVTNSNQNDVSLLQSLGVSNSSVFMANCTIWVEGISDKILIKKYLEKYFEKKGITKYREDIHYAFVEYGGNNITHWDFEGSDAIHTINSKGITNRSFIVCDNDGEAKGKKKRKENLKRIFGENYCELTVREIENTISRNVLERALFKGGETQIKRAFEERDYMKKTVYMGKFIDEHYRLTRKYASSKGSGTIKEKLNFARKIADEINDYSDLSRQARDLCKKIVGFIEKSNS